MEKLAITKRLLGFLLLSNCSISDNSLLFGKSGLATVLFCLSKILNDSKIENYAIDILHESLLVKNKDFSISKGRAGVAFMIRFLIKNKYIDADYKDLYGIESDELFTFFKSSSKRNVDILERCRILMLLYYFKEEGSDSFYANTIDDFLSPLKNSEGDLLPNRYVLYRCLAILLGFCNACEDEKLREYMSEYLSILIDKEKTYDMNLHICDNIGFLREAMDYSMKYRTELITYYSGKMNMYMNNLNLNLPTLENLNELIYTYSRNVSLLSLDVQNFINDNIIRGGEQSINVKWLEAMIKFEDIRLLPTFKFGFARFLLIYFKLKGEEKWTIDEKMLMCL